jgi:hypothetical protein
LYRSEVSGLAGSRLRTKTDGEEREPFPVDAKRPVMGGARTSYGTVMVVPSPVAVMENVPAVLDA